MDSIALGNILYISRAFSNYRRQLKLEDTLMPSEMLFISYIHRNPGCTQEQIVKFTGMDKTTVAHRLNKLEELCYVRREVSDEDARKRLCYPMEKTEEIYPKLHEQYVEFKKKVLDGFSDEELAIFDRMSTQMKQRAEEFITVHERKNKQTKGEA